MDAFFGPRTRIAGFDRLPGDYDCSLGGNAFMTLPNNEFADWWNPAFDRFRASGKFEELCEESQVKHGRYLYYSKKNCVRHYDKCTCPLQQTHHNKFTKRSWLTANAQELLSILELYFRHIFWIPVFLKPNISPKNKKY